MGRHLDHLEVERLVLLVLTHLLVALQDGQEEFAACHILVQNRGDLEIQVRLFRHVRKVAIEEIHIDRQGNPRHLFRDFVLLALFRHLLAQILHLFVEDLFRRNPALQQCDQLEGQAAPPPLHGLSRDGVGRLRKVVLDSEGDSIEGAVQDICFQQLSRNLSEQLALRFYELIELCELVQLPEELRHERIDPQEIRGIVTFHASQQIPPVDVPVRGALQVDGDAVDLLELDQRLIHDHIHMTRHIPDHYPQIRVVLGDRRSVAHKKNCQTQQDQTHGKSFHFGFLLF